MASCDKTIELTDRQSCDTELLCNGAFSPLTGFMTEEEFNAVVENMRLPSGVIMGARIHHRRDVWGVSSVGPARCLFLAFSKVAPRALSQWFTLELARRTTRGDGHVRSFD